MVVPLLSATPLVALFYTQVNSHTSSTQNKQDLDKQKTQRQKPRNSAQVQILSISRVDSFVATLLFHSV